MCCVVGLMMRPPRTQETYSEENVIESSKWKRSKDIEKLNNKLNKSINKLDSFQIESLKLFHKN